MNNLLRKNIASLEAYSSARDEFQGEASVYLDANESPFNAPYNRYPDPLQRELKKLISSIKYVPSDNIFLGNGSDEPIDLIYRAFCEPRVDNVVAIEPTYGMYKVCANINDVEYRKVMLSDDFQLNAQNLLQATDSNTKVIWICSPNNPTANLLDKNEILEVLDNFKGIVVVDEAYIDFANDEGFKNYLSDYPHLIILQTFSKAWGKAAIRLGMAFASNEIISIFNKIKYPYNINLLTQQHALESIKKDKLQVSAWIETSINERERVEKSLRQLNLVQKIYPSNANFLLIRVENANKIYNDLVEQGIIVRNRNSVALCAGCLRITIGTKEENNILLEALKQLNF